jgi:GxxExxY protein
MEDIKALCDQVRQTAYDIHVYHGQGHLEKVYENALVNRLLKMGLRVEQQFPIKVFDEDGTEIGDYLPDLLVEGVLIVELKAAKTLVPEHEAQILGYLKSSRLEHGLLINFGSYRFQIRKFARRDTPPAGGISLSGACGFLISGISALFSIPRFKSATLFALSALSALFAVKQSSISLLQHPPELRQDFPEERVLSAAGELQGDEFFRAGGIDGREGGNAVAGGLDAPLDVGRAGGLRDAGGLVSGLQNEG